MKKVLCLHGFQQNAEIFAMKSTRLRNSIKEIEFVFISAPFYANSHSNLKSWKDCTGSFEESIRCVTNFWNVNGPFHGMMGFSQGTSLIAEICKRNILPELKFVILFSGCFLSDEIINEKINIPSLHIFGRGDKQIPFEKMKNLAESFKNSEIIEHEEGHHIISKPFVRSLFVSFIQKLT